MKTCRFVDFILLFLIFVSACASTRNGGIKSARLSPQLQTPRGKLIRAGGQRAVISMTLDVPKWKQQSRALFDQMPDSFRSMFPPEMQSVFHSESAPMDMLLKLIAKAEGTIVESLEGVDETRPVVLAIGEVPPVTISDILALTDLHGYLQGYRQTVRPLYHRIILPATDAAALEASLCAQIAHFEWESLSPGVVKNSTCGFFIKKTHALVLPVRADDHVRVEIAQIDVPGRVDNKRLSAIIGAIHERRPQEDPIVDTPATRYFYEMAPLVGALFRGWRLADVATSLGIHDAAAALTAMGDGPWTTQAMESAVSTIGSSYLYLNSQPAELDDLAVSVDDVLAGNFTFVASLSRMGQKMFVDSGNDSPQRGSRRILFWLGFPFNAEVSPRYLPEAEYDVDDVNQLSECGFSCYLHAIIRAPFSYQSMLTANGLSLGRHTDNFIGGRLTGKRVGNALVMRTTRTRRPTSSDSMTEFSLQRRNSFGGVWDDALSRMGIQPESALFVAMSDLMQKYKLLASAAPDQRLNVMHYRLDQIAPLIYAAREIEGHQDEADAIEKALVLAALNTKKIIEAMPEAIPEAIPNEEREMSETGDSESEPEIHRDITKNDLLDDYEAQLKKFLTAACDHHLDIACQTMNLSVNR